MTPPVPTPAAEATRALIEAVGEPETRTQFIVAMATYMSTVGRLPAKITLPIAATAYQAFIVDNQTIFGDQAYAWDFAAACIVAEEYEMAHWPSNTAFLTHDEAAHADRT